MVQRSRSGSVGEQARQAVEQFCRGPAEAMPQTRAGAKQFDFVRHLFAQRITFTFGLFILLRHFRQLFLDLNQPPVRFQVIDPVRAVRRRLAVRQLCFAFPQTRVTFLLPAPLFAPRLPSNHR